MLWIHDPFLDFTDKNAKYVFGFSQKNRLLKEPLSPKKKASDPQTPFIATAIVPWEQKVDV